MIARLPSRLADWCFVELLQPDGSIDRAAMAVADPRSGRSRAEYDRRYPLDPEAPVGSPQVIRTGEPDLQPEISDAMRRARRAGRRAPRGAPSAGLPLDR